MTLSPNRGNDPPERLWVHDDQTDVEDQSADFAASLVSLGFISAAIRRSARFWGAMAVLGLLIGAGLYLASPHPTRRRRRSSSRTVPSRSPARRYWTSRPLRKAVRWPGSPCSKLGLQEDVSSFLGSYTATVVTDRVLLITVNAPSSNER